MSSTARPSPTRASTAPWSRRASGKSDGVRPPASGEAQCETISRRAASISSASACTVSSSWISAEYIQPSSRRPSSTAPTMSSTCDRAASGLASPPSPPGIARYRPSPPAVAPQVYQHPVGAVQAAERPAQGGVQDVVYLGAVHPGDVGKQSPGLIGVEVDCERAGRGDRVGPLPVPRQGGCPVAEPRP